MEVLHRCVADGPEESGGQPDLREVKDNHWVACWEAAAAQTVENR